MSAVIDTGRGRSIGPESSGPVPTLRIAIERAQKRADLFGTKTERNRLFIESGQAMGAYFLDQFLPLRINRAYASNVLGYGIGGRIPFVDTGDTMRQVFQRAKTTTRMAQGGGGPFTLIQMMAPNETNKYPDVLRGLSTIAPREVVALAKVFQIEAAVIANGADRRRIARGSTAGQIRLSMATAANPTRAAYQRARLSQTFGLRPRSGQRQSAMARLPTAR